tara:strand:- start:6436 stop:7206 length:771 start_codon:yes stop_codon:yes gene_type:complete
MQTFLRFLQRDNFSSFIKDKKIALVGPANYLNYFEFGKDIDNYDLVARINRGIELVNKNNNNKIGSKTDILFNCLIESNDNGGQIKLRDLKKNKVKWICTIPSSDYSGYSISNKLSSGVSYLTVLKLKYFLNLHIFDYKKYNELNKKVQCRTNTGFSAIFDLLESGAKEVFITGFSFYLDSFMKGYKKGCSRTEDEFAKDCFSSVRHDQLNQWLFLKKNKNDPRLSFDPVLKEILKIKKLDRIEFDKILKKLKSNF